MFLNKSRTKHTMFIHRLKRVISQGESDNLDFKQTINDASKIAKTLVAFANHKGGTLLIGVKDNGHICGIKNEDEKYMVELAASFYCKPEIKVEFNETEIEGKTVLEATIEQGKDKPYFAKDEHGKWWVYIRVNDKTMQASVVQFQVLKKQRPDHENKLNYSHIENEILNTIKSSSNSTLNDLVKSLNVNRNRIVYSLTKLICFGVIKIEHNQQNESYSLANVVK